MIPIILSGGSGTRMWPYSRAMYPKQFLPLVGENTMIQSTLLRLGKSSGVEPSAEPIVICNEEHRFMAAEQLREVSISAQAIILEPAGRNTAPAIALAALKLLSTDSEHRDETANKQSDAIMLVLPADHVINDINAFHQALSVAEQAANDDKLVTFGIVPSYAETGYGYIQTEGSTEAAQTIQQFMEKPDAVTAQQYVDSGNYYWNSGMFVFKASRYIEELEKFAPDIVTTCRAALDNAAEDADFTRVDKASFLACPSDSIDYAVMEKTEQAVMVPLDAGWNDVGSWASLWAVCDKDEQGNTLRGDVIAEQTSNCFIQSEDKLIATVGLDNIVVVQTDDTILVAAKDKVQDVKTIVSQLKEQDRPETQFHRKVYRPWGYYDSIDAGERFQVKRIVVKPGAKLSLQMHHHRAEHWVVVSGTAEVTNGDATILLRENESTYIPIGVTHSLANPGTIPLEIIEVQSGSYLGEDDIVRFEDKYGRV